MIEIVEGSEVEGIDIKIGTMERARDIYGRIVDAATSKGLSGIELSIGVTDENSSSSRGSGDHSDYNGAFHLSSLRPGKYWIIPKDDNAKRYFGAAVEYILGDDDLQGIEIKMYEGGIISGKAVFEGIDDPAIKNKLNSLLINTHRIQSSNSQSPNVSREMFSNRASERPDANGDFVVKGVNTGKMYLSLGYSGRGVTASLRIHSVVLDPEYIADALQTEPTGTHKMGERMSSRNPNSAIFQSHIWILESPLSSENDIEDHIKYLVEFIEQKLPILKELMTQCEADLFCGYSSANNQGGIYLEAEILKKITVLPIDVIFDIYTINRDGSHT